MGCSIIDTMFVASQFERTCRDASNNFLSGSVPEFLFSLPILSMLWVISLLHFLMAPLFFSLSDLYLFYQFSELLVILIMSSFGGWMCRNLSSNQFAGILDGNVTCSVNLQMLLERNNITGVVNFPSEFLNAKWDPESEPLSALNPSICTNKLSNWCLNPGSMVGISFCLEECWWV